MRPTEYNIEDVITAGEELLTSGKNISGFALRQCIGSGTPSTLKREWEAYLMTRHITKAPIESDLPAQVAETLARITMVQTEQLSRAVKELNRIAVQSADARVEELLRTQAEKDKQNEEEVTEATAVIEELEAEREDRDKKIEALEKQLSQALVDCNAAHEEATQAREAAARLSGQLEAVTAQNTKLLAVLEPKKEDTKHKKD